MYHAIVKFLRGRDLSYHCLLYSKNRTNVVMDFGKVSEKRLPVCRKCVFCM